MSSQPDYKLIYFNFRGRGEPVRWVLAAAGLKYTEETIERIDWPKRQKELKLGRLPVLVVDGVELQQTTTICEYLGQKHGLAPDPKDLWLNARLKEVADTYQDMTVPFQAIFKELREGKRMEVIAPLLQQSLERREVVSKYIEECISDKGWIFSDKMTWVDIVVSTYMDHVENYDPNCYKPYPKLKKLLDTVRETPGIAERIKTRAPLQPFESAEGLASFFK